MTKARFIEIQQKRGYKVETLGNIVILRNGNYTAYHFFNADGSVDKTNPAYWTVK